MDGSFKIAFDFNLDSSAKVLRLQGEVVLHHSTPHYKISRINRFGHTGGIDLLPDIDIKCILIDGQPKWVHTDSGKESNLSTMAGKAIESVQPAIEMAEENSCTDDDDAKES
jgi:hypothetical protein